LGVFCSKDYPGCESSSTSSESDSPAAVNKESRVRKLPLHHWDDIEKKTIDRLPEDIDGMKVYVINGFTKNKDALKLLKDGRRWKKNCPTNWQGHRRVRYADCKGSSICENENCPYKVQYGIINRTQFEKRSRKNTTIVCKGCGNVPKFISCPAVDISAMKENL
jgi:hypothetical protein